MRRVVIPQTNLSVSTLCLGTGFFGSSVPHDLSLSLLDSYFEAGGNFLDTANAYMEFLPGGKGKSEATIADWVKSRGVRKNVVIATKGGHPRIETLDRPRLKAEEVRADLVQSLERLGVEQIDLYWLHRDDPQVPVAEILDYLTSFVSEGLVRFLGCSNWTTERMKEAADLAKTRGLDGFVANEPMWSLARPNPGQYAQPLLVAMDEEMYEFHRSTGMACTPYSSQALGYLTKLDRAGPEGLDDAARRRYDSPGNRKGFEVAREIAKKRGVEISHIALAYLIAQPFTTIPIVGCKRLADLADSQRGAEVLLSGAEVEALDEAFGARS